MGADDPTLQTPLAEVTFVVLDLETTGGSPTGCAITEVGALKYRGGVCVGTFETLVNPGVRLPPDIVYLTGITEAMVAPAPMIESVLPAFSEFIGDAVIVGHNVRFDLAFLRANRTRLGYSATTNRSVDTCLLARRLLADEVTDCRLGTLARHLAIPTTPCHRAFADAAATAELFHLLLERVGTIGVTALDDLLALPATARHPQFAKLRWVAPLPRSPGVFLFRDGRGEVIYVGRARNLRRRVRSLFTSTDGRRIGPLLREAQSLDHQPCADDAESQDVELDLLRRHRPRYNRQVRLWERQRFVRLPAAGRAGRPTVVRTPGAGDERTHLGPFGTPALARAVVEALVGGPDADPDILRRLGVDPGLWSAVTPAPAA